MVESSDSQVDSGAREYRVSGSKLQVGQAAVFGFIALALIVEWARGEPDVEWFLLLVLIPAAVFFYQFLQSARVIRLLPGGEVHFVLGLGTKVTSAHQIRKIRPFIGSSKTSYVIEFEGGNVSLLGDPTLVAVFAADLLRENENVILKGVPVAPGKVGTPAA